MEKNIILTDEFECEATETPTLHWICTVLAVLPPGRSSSNCFSLLWEKHPGCLSISLQLGRLQNRHIHDCLLNNVNIFQVLGYWRLIQDYSIQLSTGTRNCCSDRSRNLRGNLDDDATGIRAPTNRSWLGQNRGWLWKAVELSELCRRARWQTCRHTGPTRIRQPVLQLQRHLLHGPNGTGRPSILLHSSWHWRIRPQQWRWDLFQLDAWKSFGS